MRHPAAKALGDHPSPRGVAALETAIVESTGNNYLRRMAAQSLVKCLEREELCAHVRDIGPYFQERLQELHDIPIVGDVRGKGLMACVECVISRESRDPLTLDHEIGARIEKHCQALGLVIRPLINMFVFSPPLIITKPQIDELVAILREGIERAMADVKAEGVWRG